MREFEASEDQLYEQSDFKKRRGHAFGTKKLKDNRPSSQFAVNESGFYTDDLDESKFEIYHSDDGGRYLVFLLSIFKISMAYDEELMMRELEIGLSIFPEVSKTSLFSSNQQFLIVAILATAIVVAVFFVALYTFILPEHIKDKVFGLSNKEK